MKARDLRLAFLVVWLILGGAILLILLAPLVLPAGTLATMLPPCEWQVRYGRPCPFCGMTTAFILISRGQLDAACRSNPFSIPLYALFVLNEIAVVAWGANKTAQWLQGKKRAGSGPVHPAASPPSRAV